MAMHSGNGKHQFELRQIFEGITCPRCEHMIDYNQIVRQGLVDQIRREVESSMESEKTRIENEAEEIANKRLRKLEAQIASQNELLKAERSELKAALKQNVKLESKAADFELQVQRRMKAERQKLRSEVEAEMNLRLQEKDETIAKMKAKWQAGASFEMAVVRGDALESQVEDALIREFPYDDVTRVKKGARGADISQKVRNQGVLCGSILWEVKNAQRWNEQWIGKLRSDLSRSSADIGVVVSRNLPKDSPKIANREGIWITDHRNATILAGILRHHLSSIYNRLKAYENQEEKAAMICKLISSEEFARNVGSIFETIDKMADQISRERRAMEKQWKHRQTQVEGLGRLASTTLGALGGILGDNEFLATIFEED